MTTRVIRAVVTAAVLAVSAAACQPTTLVGWGAGGDGQLGPDAAGVQAVPLVIDAPWRTVSTGSYLGAGVRSDGTLWQWGSQFTDQCSPTCGVDNALYATMATPTALSAPGMTFTSVWQGTDHLLALTGDGRLVCWGSDTVGQCGSGSVASPTYVPGQEVWRYPGPSPETTWLAASAGHRFSVGIGADGSLWTWGQNDHGQLGVGSSVGAFAVWPQQVGTGTWSAVSAGTTHALGIASDGSLWAWGDNSTGQLGTPPATLAMADEPVVVDPGPGWTAVAAGDGFSLALRLDGTLWAWGRNESGELGDGTTVEHDAPEQIGTGTDWTSISAGVSHALARRSDGSAWAWGDDAIGELGDGATVNDFLYFGAGCRGFGATYAATAPVRIGTATDWADVSAGGCYSLGLQAGGADLDAWGVNALHVYGDGGSASSGSPTVIGPAHDWTSVGEGADHSVGIRADGSLWAWGADDHGQLGDGTTTQRAVPARIGTDLWRAAGAGDGYTVAVRNDGTLWAWGRDDAGQLGDGGGADRSLPEQIGTATTWNAVSVGADHVLALRTDGTLWAWGDNAFGELGDGTTVNGGAPQQIGTATWRSVSAGFGDSLAVRADGTLWAWGLNACGELGDATTTTDGTPHQIGGATTWTSVSAGRLHTVAVRADGTLWAWGRNGYGQLGDGTTTDRHDPVPIAGATTWRSASAGYDVTVAVRADGTLWAWGRNSSGQLGDGTTTDQHSPEQLGTATTWTAIAAGAMRQSTLALHR